MITNIDIDIFKQESDAMCHQTNCFNTMGGGIAARVRVVYPEAEKADNEFGEYGDKSKLGKISLAQSKKTGRWIYNVYSQFSLGMEKRQTDYEAFFTGLTAVKNSMLNMGLKTLAIPRNMGCTLGGGDWRICEKMIECVFDSECGIDVTICNYQPS